MVPRTRLFEYSSSARCKGPRREREISTPSNDLNRQALSLARVSALRGRRKVHAGTLQQSSLGAGEAAIATKTASVRRQRWKEKKRSWRAVRSVLRKQPGQHATGGENRCVDVHTTFCFCPIKLGVQHVLHEDTGARRG